MGDEIDRINVIEVWRSADGLWQARAGGDDPRAAIVMDRTPERCLLSLARRLAEFKWPFDPTWEPK